MYDRYPDLQLQLQLARYEPLKLNPLHLETRQFKDTLPLDYLNIIYVYRVSDGHPFLILENWLEASSGRHLIFLEDDLYTLHKLTSQDWAKRMLDHPQVHLRFLHAPQDLVLERCAREFPSERVAVTTLEKKTKAFHTLKLSLLRKTVLWNSLTSEILSGHLLHRNIFSNFQKLTQSFYVNTTKGAFKGKPALICGAGPSLSDAAEEIKKLRDHTLLIGCGSALSSLSHLGIRPHIGMAIDPNAREKECLQGCTYRDLPLIYGNRLFPEVFEFFDGPYGYLRSPTGSALEKAIEEKLGLTDIDVGLDLGREALSVTTLAISLACFWECSPIILAGVDLAYAGKTHYAKGVPVHLTKSTQETRAGEQVIYRKGAQGKRVATLIKWVMEQETIDAYSRLYPNITFINATGKGLGFPSIPHKNWKEIDSLLAHTSPLDTDVQKMIAAHPVPVTQSRLIEVLGQFKRSFQRCLDLAKLLQNEPEASGKAIYYEFELEDQKAYQLTLKPALDALERIYLLNVELPFSKQKWKFLQEMTEEYIQLF